MPNDDHEIPTAAATVTATHPDDAHANVIREQLTALRDLEPSADEISRVRALAANDIGGRRWPVRPVAFVPAAVLAMCAVAAIAFLPAGQTTRIPGATEALVAAASAADNAAGPAAFSGFRHVVLLTHEEKFISRPTARPGQQANYTVDGREELWIDSRQRGVMRVHSRSVSDLSGDPSFFDWIKKTEPSGPTTTPYAYGDGTLARVPLAALPTDPAKLLREVKTAERDGRWSPHGRWTLSGVRASEFDHWLALTMVSLLATTNATPALRGATFRALALMDGVKDLGRLRDPQGREGHGIEVSTDRFGSALRVIFDPATSDILWWRDTQGRGLWRRVREHVILSSNHVDQIPADVRRAVVTEPR